MKYLKLSLCLIILIINSSKQIVEITISGKINEANSSSAVNIQAIFQEKKLLLKKEGILAKDLDYIQFQNFEITVGKKNGQDDGIYVGFEVNGLYYLIIQKEKLNPYSLDVLCSIYNLILKEIGGKKSVNFILQNFEKNQLMAIERNSISYKDNSINKNFVLDNIKSFAVEEINHNSIMTVLKFTFKDNTQDDMQVMKSMLGFLLEKITQIKQNRGKLKK
jgi:hypothetical protein